MKYEFYESNQSPKIEQYSNTSTTFLYSDLLIPSDEEWDSVEDHLWAHALHCASYCQIQLTTEWELWRRTQVTQRLQTLESNNMNRNKVSANGTNVIILLKENQLNR